MVNENGKSKAAEVAEILGDWDWANGESNIIEHTDTSRYIIGLDPGGTSGMAIVQIDPANPKQLPGVIFLDQVPEGLHGFTDYFEDFVIGDNADLVSEQWVERNIKGADRTPIYIEGAMHAMYGDYNVNWQEPSQKELIGDDFLKEQGIWVEGKRHAMDALIHALVFLRNEGHEGTVAALSGQAEGTIGEGGQAVMGDGTAPGDGTERTLAQYAREVVVNKDDHEGWDSSEGDGDHDRDISGEVEIRTTKKRELDGGFIGFVSAEEGEEEVSLFDD